MRLRNILNGLKVFYIASRIKFQYKSKKNKKIVLFPCEPSINQILSVLPIYLSIYKAGYKIEIYMSIRNLGLIPFYLILGVSRFHFIITFSLKKSNFADFKDLFNYEKYTLPSLVRHCRADSINLIKNRDLYITKLEEKITNILNNFSNINFKNIHAAFFTDYVFIPQGPMLEYLDKYEKKVTLFSYSYGNTSDTFIINKIDSAKNIRHAYTPPLNLFNENLASLDLKSKQKMISETKSTLIKFYENREWFNWAGTSSFMNSKEDKKDILSFLNNPKGIVNFGLFPHIYWDCSAAYGEDIFEDYKDWFETILDFILKNTNSNVIIKDHPSNILKLQSLGLKYISPVKNFIDKFPSYFNERIVYLPPETRYSTLEVINSVNYVLTVRGTVGVEACLLGKETIFAGTGRFNGYKFGLFPANKEEYFDLIRKASENKIEEQNNILFAANYLNLLWNKMTYKQSIVKTRGSCLKNPKFRNKDITTLNISNINNQIRDLSNWFLNPSSTFINKKTN